MERSIDRSVANLRQIQIYGKSKVNTDLWQYFCDPLDDPGDVNISQGAIFL